MAIWTLLTSVMVFVRKQWMEYEHLSYPIAQVPAEVCMAAGNPGARGTIFRSKPFWFGLAASFLLYSSWGVSYYAFGKAGRAPGHFSRPRGMNSRPRARAAAITPRPVSAVPPNTAAATAVWVNISRS